MSSSDSEVNDESLESESSSTTDELENNVNNLADDIADDLHMDNIDDAEHFQSLYDDLYQQSVDLSELDPLDLNLLKHIHPAMNDIFPHALNLQTSLPKFGDSLDDYLDSTPLMQRSASEKPFYFSFDPVTSSFSGKLFIGNVIWGSTWEQLKEYFTKEGFPVRYVNILNKSVRIFM